MAELTAFVLTLMLSFLSIPTRLRLRRVCKEWLLCCPSPWRRAGDVLSLANAFDVCFECSAKRSLKGSAQLRIDDGLNAERTRTDTCDCTDGDDSRDGWPWRGKAVEDADEFKLQNYHVSFVRQDPRRDPAFSMLCQDVEKRSHLTTGAWASTGPFAPEGHRSPEAQRLRALLDFSSAAVQRLMAHHVQKVDDLLALSADAVALRGQESKPGDTYVGEDSGRRSTREKLNAMADASPTRYLLTWHLASLRVATEELFSGYNQLSSYGYFQHVYWFRNDSATFAMDDEDSGDLGISEAWGSSLRDATAFYLWDLFETAESQARSISFEPCSDEHFEFLLTAPAVVDPLIAMLGVRIFERQLDATSSLRARWPEIIVMINELDAQCRVKRAKA